MLQLFDKAVNHQKGRTSMDHNDKHYEVVVVGGGIAGLTAAAYLGRQGIKTLLLEKNPDLGGLVSSYDDDGFVFDWGIRAFENSGILFPMFKQLGIDMEFVKNPVTLAMGHDRVCFAEKSDIDRYLTMLTKHFPEHGDEIKTIGQEIRKVMATMDVLYGMDNPLFMENFKDKEYLLRTLLPWAFRAQKSIRAANKLAEPVNHFLSRFTDNPALIDAITQHFFKDTPTFFALGYFSMYLDYVYPKGGTGKLVANLKTYLADHSVDVQTDALVRRIEPVEQWVQTESGSIFHYKRLIWCANGKDLYDQLWWVDWNDQKTLKRVKDKQQQVDSAHGGDSVLSFYISTVQHPDSFSQKTSAHLFYTPNLAGLHTVGTFDIDSEQDPWSWMDDYLEKTTYEISIPSLRDASLSPTGKTGVIVSTLFDYDVTLQLEKTLGSEVFKERASQKVLQILDQGIFPGIMQGVKAIRCTTPRSIAHWAHTHRGAITGWGFDNRTMPSLTRFQDMVKAIHTPIPNVYQAGQWSYSPSGIPVCILTGKLAGERAAKDLKVR
jgi:phytoene dehydrogenase-like protein